MLGYYTILGVRPSATVEEIRKAYRKKAKQFHPDKNKDPKALEYFLLLTEAYEYLTREQPVRETPEHAPASGREPATAGRSASELRYEEFLDSPYYQSVNSLFVIVEALRYLLLVLIVAGLPLAGWMAGGITGLLTAGAIVLITAPLTVPVLRTPPAISFTALGKAVAQLGRTRAFMAMLITIFNLIVLMKAGIHTLVLPGTLLLLYLVPMLGAAGLIGILYAFGRKRMNAFVSCCVVPFAVNLLLLANFVFSSSPTEEQHLIKPEQSSTLVELQHNAYAEYPGIRLFPDFRAITKSYAVVYRFEEGLFGIRVMKSYALI